MSANPFDEIADQAASIHFDADYCANDPHRRRLEGMGIALARWTGFVGRDILIIAKTALEDSNFHAEAEAIDNLLKRTV